MAPKTRSSSKSSSSEEKKGSRANWNERETANLIGFYNDKYVEINKENLKTKHWNQCAIHVNASKKEGDPTTKTSNNCKKKWETLRRRYKKESKNQNKTGGAPSKWPLFSQIDQIIGQTPKMKGIQGALDAGVKQNIEIPNLNSNIIESSNNSVDDKSGDDSESKASSKNQNNSTSMKRRPGVTKKNISKKSLNKKESRVSPSDLICTTLLELIKTFEKVAATREDREDKRFQELTELLRGSLQNEDESNKNKKDLQKNKKYFHKYNKEDFQEKNEDDPIEISDESGRHVPGNVNFYVVLLFYNSCIFHVHVKIH